MSELDDARVWLVELGTPPHVIDLAFARHPGLSRLDVAALWEDARARVLQAPAPGKTPVASARPKIISETVYRK